MVSCSRVCLFVWRRLLLQTLWRHCASLVVELVFVVATLMYMLYSDRVDQAQVKKLNRSYLAVPEPRRMNAEHLRPRFPPGLTVIYGPGDEYTDQVVATIFSLIGRVPTNYEEPPPDAKPEDEKEKVTPSDYVQRLDSVDSVPGSCRKASSRLLRRNAFVHTVGRTMCVQFETASTPKGLRYSIVMLVPPEIMIPEGILYSAHDLFADPSITAGSDVVAMVSDTLHVQQALIDQAHMALQGGSTNAVELHARHFPLEAPFEDIHNYRNGFFAALSISFCLPLVWRVRDVTTEIESGLKFRCRLHAQEVQEVMGLTSSEFWLGHFFSALPISIVEGVLATAVIVLHEKEYRPSRNVTVYKSEGHDVTVNPFPNADDPSPTPNVSEPLSSKFVRVYPNNPRATRYFENADGSLVVVCFLLFCACHTFLALLVACVFPHGRWAMVIAFAVFFMFPSLDGDKLGFIFGTSLFTYLSTPRTEKLRTAFYPNVALSTVMKIIGIFDDFERAAHWRILKKPALNLDNVSIRDMLNVMFATCVIFALMITYLSHVLPWTTLRPQHILFPVLPSYWSPPTGTGDADEEQHSRVDEARFESAPSQKPAIECKNITKAFDDTIALNKVDMVIYRNQVTVLLGHNGAGKTTLMSIFTGLLEADSGAIFVRGREVTSYTVRGVLGFCPQADIFFPDLTVLDHLQYFGILKGLRSSEINRNVKILLETVQLGDKLYAYPDELSGGMRRQLSIAIALITRPRVLILDEPTVGMDPETRRVVWTLVQGMRGRTTLLLSTHDMEEAERLADRIVVMYKGHVICSGSPSFLKNACGVGYKLRISKRPDAFRAKEVLAVAQRACPSANVEEDKDDEAVIAMNTLKRDGFQAMFLELEREGAALGILSLGVSVATMKDAYLRIYDIWAEGAKEKGVVTATAAAPITAFVHGGQRRPRTWQRFRALIQKRLLYLWRTPFLFLTGWILPLVIAYIGISIVKLNSFQLPFEYRYIDLDASAFVGAEMPRLRTFIQEEERTKESLGYRVLLESANVPHTEMQDALRSLAIMVEMWNNPLSVIAASIQQNLIDTVLLRQQTGQPQSRIHTGVSLYTLTEEEIRANVVERDPLNDLAELLQHTWAYWGVMGSVSFGLIMSSFVVLPSLEVCSEARQLQLMTGVSGFLYLVAHFLFDLIFYLVPMAIIYGGFAVIFNLHGDTLAWLLIIMISFAPLGILLPYLISEHASDSSTAYAIVLGLFTIAGPGTIIGFLYASDALEGENVRLPFMFFPPFALSAATVRAVNLKYEVAICDYLQSKKKLLDKHIDFCNSVNAYGSAIRFCCEVLTNRTRDPWYEITAVSISPHGILLDIFIMLLLGFLVFLYLLYRALALHAFSRQKLEPPPQKPPDQEDQDVAAEREAVEFICRQQRFGQHTLVVRSLHKVFGPVHAVRGLWFALKPGECFGLLGVNGAGKTTTFRMLAGLIQATYGDAYMKGAVLSDETRKWQSKLGYCPQGGALLDKLNAYEMLYLFGRLRGVPEDVLPGAVDHIIYVTDLSDQAAKRCQHYSGGNRRKLSMAVALIGLPELVLLDEPYAGVDVLARTRIHEALNPLKNRTKTTIVLTSHSMEECELSCDRICIMVEGEMVCLGTLQHIKDRFGKGYKLLFTLEEDTWDAVEKLTKGVLNSLPAITVVDVRRRVLEFRMEGKLPWSTLFHKLAVLEREFPFEHVLVSDNTLEQIFIEFARKAHAEKPRQTTTATSTASTNFTDE
ncbi:phospholipid-transporting ATPase ABCA3-like isoform X3 [Dermacentor albipictus]|uniref:phospholipid-transporting ATPase ABCA3-like isoform X3 n=1 Tax=Dermacentor albipictus TaxID=60249 RepID=UPI0031FDC948